MIIVPVLSILFIVAFPFAIVPLARHHRRYCTSAVVDTLVSGLVQCRSNRRHPPSHFESARILGIRVGGHGRGLNKLLQYALVVILYRTKSNACKLQTILVNLFVEMNSPTKDIKYDYHCFIFYTVPP